MLGTCLMVLVIVGAVSTYVPKGRYPTQIVPMTSGHMRPTLVSPLELQPPTSLPAYLPPTPYPYASLPLSRYQSQVCYSIPRLFSRPNRANEQPRTWQAPKCSCLPAVVGVAILQVAPALLSRDQIIDTRPTYSS